MLTLHPRATPLLGPRLHSSKSRGPLRPVGLPTRTPTRQRGNYTSRNAPLRACAVGPGPLPWAHRSAPAQWAGAAGAGSPVLPRASSGSALPRSPRTLEAGGRAPRGPSTLSCAPVLGARDGGPQAPQQFPAQLPSPPPNARCPWGRCLGGLASRSPRAELEPGAPPRAHWTEPVDAGQREQRAELGRKQALTVLVTLRVHKRQCWAPGGGGRAGTGANPRCAGESDQILSFARGAVLKGPSSTTGRSPVRFEMDH